jgi:hypothetical protein
MAMSKCSGHSPTQGKTVALDRLTGSIRLFCLECGGVQNKFFWFDVRRFVEFVTCRTGLEKLLQ